MSYKKIAAIPKSAKALKGRKFQYIGEKKVKKYAFSPYTAKPGVKYTFYAEVKLRKPVSSPSGNDKEPRKIEWATIPVHVGTFIEFRDWVELGEVQAHIEEIVMNMGGEGVEEVGYWRNRGELNQ
jgi:hypothetical protein